MPRGSRGYVKVEQVLEKLEIGRRGLVQVRTEAVMHSVAYVAAGEAIEEMDNVVELITGDRRHFHEKGSGDHKA